MAGYHPLPYLFSKALVSSHTSVLSPERKTGYVQYYYMNVKLIYSIKNIGINGVNITLSVNHVYG